MDLTADLAGNLTNYSVDSADNFAADSAASFEKNNYMLDYLDYLAHLVHCGMADLAADLVADTVSFVAGFAADLIVDYMLEFSNFENFDFEHSYMDSAGNAICSGEYMKHYPVLELVGSSHD